MEQKTNTAILKTIGKVFETSKGCKLEPAHFKEHDKELEYQARKRLCRTYAIKKNDSNKKKC